MGAVRKLKFIYWIVTLAFLSLMVFSAIGYLTANPQMVEGVKALGYPVYLLKILGIAKILGAIAILYGRFQTLKEWAYAGFVINVIGASMSHYFNGDPLSKVAVPLFVLVIILISYMLWKKK
ncbi:DoxX family protein [Silvanigrella aquatica]|uniref:DoxX-like family protein n=1 Tax=Silvanigrella aquatica TaxID=1915309 RepID=A0A1L4D2F5_9BACT|nr:DoxX family protein [Silvanigrella aquatica]APJ04378.1 hypothetical protein AXG55_10860 [Silvanigrella aquatica]